MANFTLVDSKAGNGGSVVDFRMGPVPVTYKDHTGEAYLAVGKGSQPGSIVVGGMAIRFNAGEPNETDVAVFRDPRTNKILDTGKESGPAMLDVADFIGNRNIHRQIIENIQGSEQQKAQIIEGLNKLADNLADYRASPDTPRTQQIPGDQQYAAHQQITLKGPSGLPVQVNARIVSLNGQKALEMVYPKGSGITTGSGDRYAIGMDGKFITTDGYMVPAYSAAQRDDAIKVLKDPAFIAGEEKLGLAPKEREQLKDRIELGAKRPWGVPQPGL